MALTKLFKWWLAANAATTVAQTAVNLYEGSKSEPVDPYLTMGKERYNTLARYVMLNDRVGYMHQLDVWGLEDMNLRAGIWKFISSKMNA